MDLFHFNLQLPITDPTWIFLLVLLIILFAPILLNKLRIPHIIGMILAGLVIGEHGLNILARDSSFELFGKVGVYYIMFLAGLEMNMSDFKKNRGKAITLGLLAFIIPIGIGMVTNMWLLKYSLLTSILLASMYASHTLVAYPIVIRYGISRHRSVSIAVGGTAVTDTLTLLVLAVISGLFKGEGGGLFWLWLVVKVVVLGTLIMQLFPRIGRWFFRRYDDNVMQFIFVLAMVFLGAGLMEFIGMEGILGAFLVGLVLNRLIPHVSPLMSHLEFVGNALFIPYFLIGVGMLIDIHVIFGGGDALKVAGVMIVVALAGKWVASWLTQKLYRMSAVERELMFGLSNAQAAATLAAVLVGYNLIQPNGERLLNEDVLNGTVLLILVTCVVSSFITERAARRVAMDEAHPEEGDAARVPEKILIPVANPATLDYLISLSLIIRDPKQKDNLVALSVINDHTETDRLELQGKRQLERAAKIAASAGINLQCISRYDLNIAAGIIHTAREYDITDLIIGLHYKVNLMDSYFGKLTESLLKGLHRVYERRVPDLPRDRFGDLLAAHALHVFDLEEYGRLSRDFLQKFAEEGNALLRSAQAQGNEVGGGERGDVARGVRHAVDRAVVKDGELFIFGKAYVRLDGVAARDRRAEGGNAVLGALGVVQPAVCDGGTCQKRGNIHIIHYSNFAAGLQ